MTKKKKMIIIIASIASVAAILVLSLILFVPYESTRDCYFCIAGRSECSAKVYAENLSGRPQYSHDCGLCENGYVRCMFCNGKGYRREKRSNFSRWF